MLYNKKKYVRKEQLRYKSKRYGKWVTVPKGRRSDGATGAIDIMKRFNKKEQSDSWWVHDELCLTGLWDDGTPCTNWQASQVLSDILRDEGRWIRRYYWFWMTWLIGGGKARENGMW